MSAFISENNISFYCYIMSGIKYVLTKFYVIWWLIYVILCVTSLSWRTEDKL